MRVMAIEDRYNHVITRIPLFTQRYFRTKPWYIYTREHEMEELKNACAICIQRFYRRNKLVHAMRYIIKNEEIDIKTSSNKIKCACKRLVHMCFALHPSLERKIYLNYYACGAYLAICMCKHEAIFTRFDPDIKSHMMVESKKVKERLMQVHRWVMGNIKRTEVQPQDMRACMRELDDGILQLKRLSSDIKDRYASKISRLWRKNRTNNMIVHLNSVLDILSNRKLSTKQIRFIFRSPLPKIFSNFLRITASLVKRFHPVQTPFDIDSQIHNTRQKRGQGIICAALFKQNLDYVVEPYTRGISLFDMNKNAQNVITGLKQLLTLIQDKRELVIDTLIENLNVCLFFLTCENTFNQHIDFFYRDIVAQAKIQIQENIDLHCAFQSLNLSRIAIHNRKVLNIQDSLDSLQKAMEGRAQPPEDSIFFIQKIFYQNNAQYPSDYNLVQSMSFDQDFLQQIVKTLDLPDTALYFLYSSKTKQFSEQMQIRHGGCTFYTNMHKAIEEIYWKHLKNCLGAPDPKLFPFFITLRLCVQKFVLSESYTEINDLLFERLDPQQFQKLEDPANNKDVVAYALGLTESIIKNVSSTLSRKRNNLLFEAKLRAINDKFRNKNLQDDKTLLLYYKARLIYKTSQTIHMDDVNAFLSKHLDDKHQEFNSMIRTAFRTIYSRTENTPNLFNMIRRLQQILPLPQILNENNSPQLILCLIISSAHEFFIPQKVQELPETLLFEMDCLWKAATWMLYNSFVLQFVENIGCQVHQHNYQDEYNQIFFLETLTTKVLVDYNPVDTQSSAWESSILSELNSRLIQDGHQFRFSPTSTKIPTEINHLVTNVYTQLAMDDDNENNFPEGVLPQQILRLIAKKNIEELRTAIAVHKEVFLEAYIKLYSQAKRMET